MPEYIPKEIDWSGDWETNDALMKENQKQLDQIDSEAKANGELLWRYIQEPCADGYAVYQIVKVNKKTVRIRNCTGLGDDWVIPYWGGETTIGRDYAELKTKRKDNIEALFSNRAE